MRSVAAARQLIGSMVFLSALGWASQAHAQLGVGTWVRTDAQGKGMTMTVAPCCNGGFRLTYQVAAASGQPAMQLVVDSPMDGTEVPALVGGKPSGETMAITRVDDHHYRAVMKMGGQPFGTSTGTLSADAKTLTVETVNQTRPGAPAEKISETWIKK
jgi:hypothetical protein